MDTTTLDREVDRNFDAFEAMMPELLRTRRDQFALLRAGEIVSFFNSDIDALRNGRERFADGLYSVQQVTDSVVDLGFFSHAVDHRLA